MNRVKALLRVSAALLPLTIFGCSGGTADPPVAASSESCMSCHNGAPNDDYGGPGLENPHPFVGAGTIACTTCHGGNPNGTGLADSHVPPPPEIGDEENQENNATAYFNRLTLTGIDQYADYTVDGTTYTALEYLQFLNPGDLRVVTTGKGCGECHTSHAECVEKSTLATQAGVLSGALYAIGVDNAVVASQTLYEDTASDYAFRAVLDADFVFDGAIVGAVEELLQFPVFSVRGQLGADDLFENPDYNVAALPADQLADGRVVTGSKLANLYSEQVAFTCGDCHLGSAGANNRYGDYRSSGCTSCHMPYSQSGRSDSTDPNIRKFEPLDPDDIDAPERPHVKRHRIVSIAKTLTTGEVATGMDDYTCAGCHQGSNRTVMQYWGIRLDQNQDVRRGHQYPANPATFRTTFGDERLFDPVVANNTFNGRNSNQYLLEEDYDGDGRDDTPADIHYEAGMGCIDCHGSHDLHGGTPGDVANSRIYSRQEQGVAIRCESCHGSVDAYATTVVGPDYTGADATMAVDSKGNPLKHVKLESDGHFYLTSRLTGNRHYVSQVRDVVVDSGVVNPLNDEAVYSVKGSYAMGRVDGSATTGIGPQQTGGVTANFSHMDNLSCASCHSSWTNTCTGCHLGGEYDNGNNFSNITGERIVFDQANADFVYQSPVFFQLGIDVHNKIAPIATNTDTFFQYRDLNGDLSKVFAMSDRNGQGANAVTTAYPAMSHNVLMPHSIRGKVSATQEGPRYCVSCHLTTTGLNDFGLAAYNSFRTDLQANDFSNLDFAQLQEQIGENTGNQKNSPLWVHMVAGLGTGLFLFDENGCAVNPLDDNEDRFGCNDVAPATVYDALTVNADAAFNLDKIVDFLGVSAGSNNHPLLVPNPATNLRDGSSFPNLSGPLGATMIERLTDPATGILLDSWLDADSNQQGDASLYAPD